MIVGVGIGGTLEVAALMAKRMTARALDSIGKVGGPRCCKRDSWLAILAAVDFVREHLGVEMARTVPVCSYSGRNSQCLGKRCPFSGHPINHQFNDSAPVLRYDVSRIKPDKEDMR